jgi:hypothetical protein
VFGAVSRSGLSGGTPVEQRLGGGPAVLTALAAAAPGTLVIAVSPEPPAGAAAALLGAAGTAIGDIRTAGGSRSTPAAG